MIELKPSRNFLSDLRDNQIAALWMLIGSKRCFDRVTPNGWQFLFWAVLACLANTLFSWLTAGGAGHFNLQGLVSYLLWPFIALIAGIFLAQRSGLGRLMLVPAMLWLIADVNVALLQSFVQFLGQIDRLPDMSRLMPDMVKKKLAAADPMSLVQETCVAECVHCWLVVLSVGMLFLWKSVWSWALWLVYNLLGNVSFILIQRYNRPRLLRLAEKENKKRL